MTNPRPWRMNANRRRNSRDPLSWLDKCHRSNKEIASIHDSLVEDIKERCGREPTGKEKIHIARAIAIKRHLQPFDDKEMLEPQDLDPYVRLSNAFQRELDKLGADEASDLQRQRAEASILNAYAR